MNNSKYIVYLLFVTILFSACKVRKAEVKANNQNIEISAEEILRANILPKLDQANFDFTYLTSKAKVKVNREGKDFTLTFNIRMHKEEKIWISVTAIGGIEVARVLLTKDSVKVIDRFNKQYIVKDYAFLSEVLKTDVDFLTIQNMMIGNNPPNINYNNSIISDNVTTYELKGKEKELSYILLVRKDDFKLRSLNLVENKKESRKINVDYNEFKQVDNASFPFHIATTASSQKESVSLNVEYQKVEKVVSLDFPFNVPKRFE